MQVYVESGDDELAEQESKQGDRILPALNKGDKLKVLNVDPEQHFTQPPPRFSEAMLVKKLEEEGVTKIRTLRSEYKSVLPACSADDCKAKSNLGWVCTGPTKKGVKGPKLAKREARDDKIAGKRDASFMNIDLKTVRIPRIESDFDAWLADSKRVWSQLRFQIAARRRMKRQRRNTVR